MRRVRYKLAWLYKYTSEIRVIQISFKLNFHSIRAKGEDFGKENWKISQITLASRAYREETERNNQCPNPKGVLMGSRSQWDNT